MRPAARIVVVLLAIAVVISVAAPAAACPVCWGASDDPMAEGANNGILVLLGVIGMVQIGFVALFVSFRRRARDYQERKESFDVIEGGVR